MADIEKRLEALEAKAVDEANSPNPQADAPKRMLLRLSLLILQVKRHMKI